VNAYTAKVCAKGRLHLGAHAAIQGLATAARALDGLFYFGSNIGFTLTLAG
jgi:hypothetical protein